MSVVPGHDRGEFFSHLPEAERDENASEPFFFQGPDEPLDDGQAAVLANGAESRLDPAGGHPNERE